MQCLTCLHQTLQGNKRKAKSPARHREAYRSRLVRLGCEVMEDRVLLSAALPDYHFTAPALVAGATAVSAKAVRPAAPSFTATAVSATQINTVHPTGWNEANIATHYAVVNGTLYGTSGRPQYYDVKQGALGDCWLLATYADAAYRNPALITRMFTDLGYRSENGVTVHCWNVSLYATNGSRVTVTVDNEFPVNSAGATIEDHPINGVLWVALAEKAYAIDAAYGWVSVGHPGYNSYYSLDYGQPTWAMHAVTDKTAIQYTTVTQTAYGSAIDVGWFAGDLTVVQTVNPPNSLIVGRHVYAVLGDNPAVTNRYTLFNPWNAGAYTTYNNHSVFGGVFSCTYAFLETNYYYADSGRV